MDLTVVDATTLALWACLAAAAALYSTSGHGGATAYLALFGLFAVAPPVMRPLALALNVLVAGLGVVRLHKVGAVPWRLLVWLLAGSVPCAVIGGLVTLPMTTYRVLLGATLLIAAARLLLPDRATSESLRTLPHAATVGIGAALGLLSGLTGIGGGIFLSPILILGRVLDPRRTAGASATFIVVNSIAGLGAVLMRGGLAPLSVTAIVGSGAAVLLGAAVGTTLVTRSLSARGLRVALAVVLVLSGLKLVSEALTST